MNSNWSGTTKRGGTVIVLMVILLPVMLIIAGFAINLAYMESVRTDMQIASDAGSRAATRTLARTNDQAAATAKAIEVVAANSIAGRSLQLQSSEVVFGSSVRPNASSRYVFSPGVGPFNSVRVNLNSATTSNFDSPLLMNGRLTSFRPSQISAATQAELDVALVVDRSGSMAYASDEDSNVTTAPRNAPPGWVFGDPAPPGSRWLEAVSAIDSFLDILDQSRASEKVCLTTYDDEVTNDVALTANTTSIRSALNVHSNAFHEGGTNIGDGIGFGVTNLTTSAGRRQWAVRVMIVLTDGIHNWGPTPESVVPFAADNEVLVYTVTFAAEADQASMRNVAAAGGGRHYHATDLATLTGAFEEIARNLPVLITE